MSGVIIRIYRLFKPKTDNTEKRTPPFTKNERKKIKNDDSRVIDVDYEEIKWLPGERYESKKYSYSKTT